MSRLVKFETAQVAKVLKFNKPVQNRYSVNGLLNKDGNIRYGEPIDYNNECFQDEGRRYISAMTLSELQMFLIDKGVYSGVKYTYFDSNTQLDYFEADIRHDLEVSHNETFKIFDNYEDALEDSLLRSMRDLMLNI